MAKNHSKPASRETRLSTRVDAHRKAVIARAAKLHGDTISEIAGLKLLLVQAKDEAAAEFYKKHGFAPVLGDSLKLLLPVPLSS
jgi:hypothetical protein